jgi:hypothetical protein
MEINKTGKYFKYTIGEIILVVIGILIALIISSHRGIKFINVYDQLKKNAREVLWNRFLLECFLNNYKAHVTIK